MNITLTLNMVMYGISASLLVGACITIAKSADYAVMICTIMDFEGKNISYNMKYYMTVWLTHCKNI